MSHSFDLSWIIHCLAPVARPTVQWNECDDQFHHILFSLIHYSKYSVSYFVTNDYYYLNDQWIGVFFRRQIERKRNDKDLRNIKMNWLTEYFNQPTYLSVITAEVCFSFYIWITWFCSFGSYSIATHWTLNLSFRPSIVG